MTTNTGRIQRFKEWVCGKIGHSFSPVGVAIFRIKTSDLNRDMSATLTCRLCKRVFVHKDSPLAEGNKP